jgi:hypothetical protein
VSSQWIRPELRGSAAMRWARGHQLNASVQILHALLLKLLKFPFFETH